MAKDEKDSPSSEKKSLVVTGPEADELCAALVWEREHAAEIDADEMRRQDEIAKYPLSDFKGKKMPPWPPVKDE